LFEEDIRLVMQNIGFVFGIGYGQRRETMGYGVTATNDQKSMSTG
jgi:high-affinity nickel permease